MQSLIEASFEQRNQITPATAEPHIVAAIEQVINELDAGALRVTEKVDGQWVTHQWIKKAVLLSFRIYDNKRQVQHVISTRSPPNLLTGTPINFKPPVSASFRMPSYARGHS